MPSTRVFVSTPRTMLVGEFMKAVILAGGLGTRISEETLLKPKPMIEIGHKPVLWHIMKTYSAAGIYDFVICLGYKGYIIKEYFANYFLHSSDVTFDLGRENTMTVHQNFSEPWKITLVDTGESTMTGGRLKRVKKYLDAGEDFCFTYGDGLTDLDIGVSLKFHQEHGGLATLMAAQPPGRFGALALVENKVKSFQEKPEGDGSWINAGYFILSPKVIDYIEGDKISWENEPLQQLASEGQLYAYKHEGFWQPMDTLRDKNSLEALWESGVAPWKVW